ncbi:MAG: class I adenylate-forming enzyme family protein [Bdellovibrionota bacterium]
MLISQTFSPIALRNGARHAFKYLKHQITYKEFWETSSRFSYFLQKEIGHGLRVGLWMSNCPHTAYCFFALANTKSCAVPLNPWAAPDENLFKIKNSEITVILCSSDHTKKLKEFLHQNGLSSIKVIDMETKRCAEYDPTYTPPAGHVPNEKDHILLFYTPGTTGKYKGCLFNHVAVGQAVTSVKSAYKASTTDVFHTQFHYSNPFNFIHFLLAPLAAGSTVFISDQVDHKTVIAGLTEARVTRFAPQLTLFPEMLRLAETEKLPIPTVKTISVSGTSLSAESWSLIKKTKIGVINIYGLTEYLGTVAMGTPDCLGEAAKPGLMGPVLVGTKVRVVDDQGDEIEKKKPQKGQLLVMGPALMDKYLGLPEEQKVMVRGTWLFTGDICEIDKEGRVFFLDRKADVVTLQDGRKIYAKEVEPVVKAIQQVEDAAFVGIRDRLKKPLSALIIVRRAQSTVTEKQIHDYLTTKLPRERMPAVVFFIDAMPRTVSGAINRAKLRSLYDGV